MNNLEKLKQTFLESDKEYQHAFVSGDSARLLQAIKERSKAFDAYNRAKRREFKKNYKYVMGA